MPSSFCFLRFFIFANWGPEKHHSKNSTFLSVDFLEYPGESKGVYDSRSGVEDNFPGKKQPMEFFFRILAASQSFSLISEWENTSSLASASGTHRGPIGDPSLPQYHRGAGRKYHISGYALGRGKGRGKSFGFGELMVEKEHPAFQKKTRWRKIGLMLYKICTDLL